MKATRRMSQLMMAKATRPDDADCDEHDTTGVADDDDDGDALGDVRDIASLRLEIAELLRDKIEENEGDGEREGEGS